MSDVQQVFFYVVLGLAGFWVVAIGYELYLRLTIKCVNCIVEDPARVRFFARLSLVIAILCIIATIATLLQDSYVVFIVFVLALYFFRLFMLARGRYKRLLEGEDQVYNPNITFRQDLRQTYEQFKLLFTSPRKFFRQD